MSLRNYQTHLIEVGARVLDTILPPRCVATGEIVDAPGMIHASFWSQMNFITDPRCNSCGRPFEFEVPGDTTCGKCLAEPPRYHQARSVLKYDDASRGLILKFKHGDQTHLAPGFAVWLARAGKDWWPAVDLITAVPLHRRRTWARRYNQSAILVQAVARHVQKSGVPDLLVRHRPTPSQKGLSARARRRNVRGAFRLRDGQDIKGKSIVLIDDVYTSGATVNECARVLKHHGAEKIYVLTLAQVC